MIAVRKTLLTLALAPLLALPLGCGKKSAPDQSAPAAVQKEAQPAAAAPAPAAALPPVNPAPTANAAAAETPPSAEPKSPPVPAARKLKLADITPVQAEQAIRETLQISLRRALEQLGADGGFRSDPNMRISMPDEWVRIDSVVRKINHAEAADAFLDALNGSAETAAKELTPLLAGIVKDLPIKDARRTLTEAADAATQTLLAGSETQLRAAVKTSIASAFKSSDLENRRQALIEKARFANPFTNITGADEFDLERYAADRVVERVFVAVARQEKAIRQDPSTLDSEIAQSVFQAAQ